MLDDPVDPAANGYALPTIPRQEGGGRWIRAQVIERVRSEAAVHETIDRSIGRDCQRERPLD